MRRWVPWPCRHLGVNPLHSRVSKGNPPMRVRDHECAFRPATLMREHIQATGNTARHQGVSGNKSEVTIADTSMSSAVPVPPKILGLVMRSGCRNRAS